MLHWNVLLQLLPLGWLFYKLQHKYGVTFTDASTLSSVGKLFAPTGTFGSMSSGILVI
jgi:hypothetical protein